MIQSVLFGIGLEQAWTKVQIQNIPVTIIKINVNHKNQNIILKVDSNHPNHAIASSQLAGFQFTVQFVLRPGIFMWL